MELSEQELVRRESLQKMRDMGIDPYPAAEYEVTGYSTDIKGNFTDEVPGDEAIRLEAKGRVVAIVTRATPRLAPEDTPKIYGPASGLRKSVCIIRPATESAAPARIAVSILGKRRWRRS